MSETTHFLRTIRDADGNSTDFLFRASDGVNIAQRQGEVVIFGDEPNRRNSRLFFDSDYAREFVTKYAEKDCPEGTTAVIEEKPYFEGSLVVPVGSVGFAKNGAISPFRN